MDTEETTEDFQENSVSGVPVDIHNHRKRGFSERDLTPKLFSVFNKPKKIVHLIRHGHTTYLDGHLRTKSGNHPFDVILSPLGFQQAAALKDKISGLGAEVILTSPLTRALQTLLNAVDFTQARRVEVCHLHTEHVSNSGDVGRPSSMLSREFPMLSFTGLEEVWWFSPKDAPNDPVMGVFRSRESMEHLRKRVGLFRQYLLSRPENIIIVIGHSTFFKELSGRRKRMENCEMLTVKLSVFLVKETYLADDRAEHGTQMPISWNIKYLYGGASRARLFKEYKEVQREKTADSDIQLICDENNIYRWTAHIKGPADTPYQEGVFQLSINVPEQYPLVPPQVRFVTKIFHPNVHFKTGEICLDILKTAWSPAWTLQSVCRAIIALMSHPEPDSPLNCDCGNLLRSGDHRGYRSMARMYTRLAAVPNILH